MAHEKVENMPDYMMMQHLLHMSKYKAMTMMEDFGLKPSQAGVLFVLNCKGRLSQRELADEIGVRPPSMTVALRKLEDLGYVRKQQDEKDQRIFRIMLTPQGEGCVGMIKETAQKMEQIMYKGITPEERMLFHRLLLHMTENLLASEGFEQVDMKTMIESMRPRMNDM